MFGYGMSSQDQPILIEGERILASMGSAKINVRRTARQLFAEVKSELHRQDPEDLYSERLGQRLMNDRDFVKQRIDAGITQSDLLEYWNRIYLLIRFENRIRSFATYTLIEEKLKRGKNLMEEIRYNRRRRPVYGDPHRWDFQRPVNRVFREVDADIYPEFQPRVRSWQERTPGEEVERVLSRSSSFNAMVRNLVALGEL